MLRKTILSITAFLAFSFNAYAQPAYLNYKHMKPITGLFASCWKLSLDNDKVNCEKLTVGLLRTISKAHNIPQRDVAYATKYLENIMFAEWYDEAIKKGLPWNQYFADAENLSIACVEKFRDNPRSGYLTIDCMNAQVRPNLKAAWAFLNGKFSKPTTQESAEVNRYFVQSMLSCLREHAMAEDTENTQLSCLTHVDKTVDKLSMDRAYDLALVSYKATYNWLSTNQVYTPFELPDAVRARCLKPVEDNAKLGCVLADAAKIARYAQTLSKSISKPFEAAF